MSGYQGWELADYKLPATVDTSWLVIQVSYSGANYPTILCVYVLLD